MHALVAGPVFLARLRVGIGDIAGRVHADRLHRPAELRKGAVIEIDIRPKPLGIAADDGKRQRQVVARGADDGFRAAADTDPGPQRPGLDRREDALILQRRTQPALPGHGVRPQQRGEQIEFFLEQHLVLGKIVAEQRKGLGERAAPHA